MRVQGCLLILTTSLCLAAKVAGAKHGVLSSTKVVKRELFDDLGGLFESVGSGIMTFTKETYNSIAENLPSMGLDDLNKTLRELKSVYQKIGDKSSNKARRVQKLMREVYKDIAANGSTSWRGSLAGTVALMVLTAYLNN